ncbi:MAG: hypothetical protein U0269_26835 [Polyangiales bacterium]
MSDERDPRSSRPVATAEKTAGYVTPTLNSAMAPYRSPGEGGGADRTHIQELDEQKARRAWGLGSLIVSLGAFASIPFALNESTFTAGMAATIGVGFGALASMALRAYARERGASVAIFDRHLVVEAAGQRREIPWDAIASITADFRAGPDHQLRALALVSIKLADGTLVAVPRAVSAAGSLAHEVLARSKPALLARTQEALDQGLRVDCGSITLTPEGLIVGAYRWAWFARPVAHIDGPFLHIKALLDPMPPSTTLIESVENLHVVLELIASGYTPRPAQNAADSAASNANLDTPATHEGTEGDPASSPPRDSQEEQKNHDPGR